MSQADITKLSRFLDDAVRYEQTEASHRTAQQAVENEAFQRLIRQLEDMAQSSVQLEQELLDTDLIRQLDDYEQELVGKLKSVQHAKELEQQIAEQRERRAAEKQAQKEPGIDPQMHGYPHRPQTPPKVRRTDQLQKQAQFRSELDAVVDEHRREKKKEAVAERAEATVAISNLQAKIDAKNNAERLERLQKQVDLKQILDKASRMRAIHQYCDDIRVNGKSSIDLTKYDRESPSPSPVGTAEGETVRSLTPQPSKIAVHIAPRKNQKSALRSSQTQTNEVSDFSKRVGVTPTRPQTGRPKGQGQPAHALRRHRGSQRHRVLTGRPKRESLTPSPPPPPQTEIGESHPSANGSQTARVKFESIRDRVSHELEYIGAARQQLMAKYTKSKGVTGQSTPTWRSKTSRLPETPQIFPQITKPASVRQQRAYQAIAAAQKSNAEATAAPLFPWESRPKSLLQRSRSTTPNGSRPVSRNG